LYHVYVSGYLFSSDITATMEKYSQQVADCVLEKAKIVCNDVQNVSIHICTYTSINCY